MDLKDVELEDDEIDADAADNVQSNNNKKEDGKIETPKKKGVIKRLVASALVLSLITGGACFAVKKSHENRYRPSLTTKVMMNNADLFDNSTMAFYFDKLSGSKIETEMFEEKISDAAREMAMNCIKSIIAVNTPDVESVDQISNISIVENRNEKGEVGDFVYAEKISTFSYDFTKGDNTTRLELAFDDGCFFDNGVEYLAKIAFGNGDLSESEIKKVGVVVNEALTADYNVIHEKDGDRALTYKANNSTTNQVKKYIKF